MKKAILYLFLLTITFLLILKPELSIYYTKKGLDLCYEIIIPSLFPFFICSGLLIYSGFCEVIATVFKPVMKPLFNINPSGAAAFILGIISGYPLGAVTTCELYNSFYISKSEAERLLAFCNNSGPLFILGAVGISMYHSVKLGIILYICHILGAISVGILFKNYKKNTFFAPRTEIKTENKNISEIFSNVLNNSIQNILTVCGAVIFCSVIVNIALNTLNINSFFYTVFLSLSEFTSGLNSVSMLDIDLFYKLLISAFVCAFAGISVHLQVMGVVSRTGLSLKPYIFGKILHGIFSVIYTFLALKIFRPSSPAVCVFSSSEKFNFSFFISSLFEIMTALFLFAMIIVVSVIKKKNKRIS